jgi:glycosyltransferase involved in cell wall biosynthesis
MKLRILFAIHGPRDPKTAVFLTVQRRAEYLAQRGHTVEIVTPADLPFGSWSRLQPLLLPVGLSMRNLRDFDIVVFHSHLGWAHAVLRGSGRSTRPATIIAFHGLEPLYYEALAAELARTGERLSAQFILFHQRLVPRLLAFAARRADRVFCLNSRERDFIVSRGWSEPARVRVLPNGVERDLFREARIYAASATRLLFTGQWLRAKGIRYLVQAFESLASRHPAIELTCVGTGAEADATRRDFARPVRDRVRVVPRVTREQLAKELERADIFVFPSLSEGFSGALLEAMASGLPVVATAAGAAADLLRAGENALIVPFADGPALIESIETLIDRADLRQQLGGAARATAAGYEWDAVNEYFASELLATITTTA